MPNRAAALVVDTSVLIKWFKDEDENLVDQALALRDRVDRAGIAVYAPALLFYEIGNVLVRKTKLDHAGITEVLAAIAGSRLVVAAPEPALLRRAAQFARRYDLSLYDAAFVALADALGCRMITADLRLAERTRECGFVRHLAGAGDMP